MRTFSKLLLAGIGSLAAAGVAIAADKAHVLDVALPDGSVAHIRYVGDVAPRVLVAPAAPALPVALFDPAPFALFDRISAQLDAQMEAMMRQAASLSAAAPAAGSLPTYAALSTAPAGTVSYSFTSYSSGKGGSCSQSVRVTSLGSDQAPKVVRQSSGDCSAMNSRQAVPAAQPASAAAPVTVSYPAKPAQPAGKHGPVI